MWNVIYIPLFTDSLKEFREVTAVGDTKYY